jgi:hypothetical protein
MTDFSITFFGTSTMEHLQAHFAVLDRQYDVPGVGESVVIDSHRRRGWVHFLFLRLQASMPGVRFSFENQGLGGATSRDVLRVVREAASTMSGGASRTARTRPSGWPSTGPATPRCSQHRANATACALDTLVVCAFGRVG